METLILLIVIFAIIIVVGLFKTDANTAEHGRKGGRADHPKSLPWFDKDYNKRKKKKKYFWDD